MKTLHALFAASLVLAAGCNTGPAPMNQTSNVKVDVGGSVRYGLGENEPLAGVTVTLTDIDGETYVTTTSATGLWVLSNLAPGTYTSRFEATGYEPSEGVAPLDAFGENDVKNVFVPYGDVYLLETSLTANVSTQFSISLREGDDPIDGFQGAVLRYSSMQDADVIVTFDRLLVGGFVYIYDLESGDIAIANQDDSSGVSVFTIEEAEIENINGGAGMTADTDPLTFNYLVVFGNGYSPIHGDGISLYATARFNAVP